MLGFGVLSERMFEYLWGGGLSRGKVQFCKLTDVRIYSSDSWLLSELVVSRECPAARWLIWGGERTPDD